jgi:hypothetical protein
MAERAPNRRVQDILLDMARTWTRLALEAEQWEQANRPTLLLNKAFSKERPDAAVGHLPSRSPASRHTSSDS